MNFNLPKYLKQGQFHAHYNLSTSTIFTFNVSQAAHIFAAILIHPPRNKRHIKNNCCHMWRKILQLRFGKLERGASVTVAFDEQS